MNLKWTLPWIIAILWLSTVHIQASIPVVNRQVLTYEVLSSHMSNSTIEISGWAFIRYHQHFLNSSTHEIKVEFISQNDHFMQSALLTPISQTTNMQFRGAPTCQSRHFFQVSSICNYHYDNVGFHISVDLNRFKVNQTYTAYLIVHAKDSNTSAKIPLYAPMNHPVTLINNQIKTTITSNIHDTSLLVNASTVVVRSGPGIDFPIVSSGVSCSSTYQNSLFYQQYSIFNRIISKQTSGFNTYYQLEGALGACIDQRRRVVEGYQISPMWILSNYVEYLGTPLTITKSQLNNPPVLTITHPTISVSQTFYWQHYVSAYDIEDGNITHKIFVISNNVMPLIGTYMVDLMVLDSQLASARGVMWVNVIDYVPFWIEPIEPNQPSFEYPVLVTDNKPNTNYSRFVLSEANNISHNWLLQLEKLKKELKSIIAHKSKRAK